MNVAIEFSKKASFFTNKYLPYKNIITKIPIHNICLFINKYPCFLMHFLSFSMDANF